MFSKVFCIAIQGIDGCVIQVEADVSDGLPCFSMVGFLASEVKEARERVCIAIKNSGIRLAPKKITVNLSPADIRKAGTGYDLAIAVAVLVAFGYIPEDVVQKIVFIGELSLEGCVRPVDGILPMVYTAYEHGFSFCVVPEENIREAQVVEGIAIAGLSKLSELIGMSIPDFFGERETEPWQQEAEAIQEETPDFSEVKGQAAVKRAVEIAAAGRHNLLMVGPPGTGKSMIAKRIPAILPELSFEECMEISKIYSVCGLLSKDAPLVSKRPFRAPHHTITQTALIGGGRLPKPGEVSLASSGVLFLDELPEFGQSVIEVLRQPLEDGFVNVSRLEGNCRYPAGCQLVAAMNPCRCGYYPDKRKCFCTPLQIKNYLNRVSRPLLDRIDICTETLPLKYGQMNSGDGKQDASGDRSAQIRERVAAAHRVQEKRYRGETFCFNAQLPAGNIAKYCRLTGDSEEYLSQIYEKLSFSARVYHKILRISRTIADLEQKEQIERRHISEAVCYRITDRKYWGNPEEAGW